MLTKIESLSFRQSIESQDLGERKVFGAKHERHGRRQDILRNDQATGVVLLAIGIPPLAI